MRKKIMYTNQQIDIIKERAQRYLYLEASIFDSSGILIEQLLNIIKQYEHNTPLWIKKDFDNA
jgi:hypothetical protein